MTDEEKEAMWYCTEILADNKNDIEHWKIIENLIDKLQKENKELKEELDYYKQREKQDFDERDYWEE